MENSIVFNGSNFREVLAWGRSEVLAAMPNLGKLFMVYPEGRLEIEAGTKLKKDIFGVIDIVGHVEENHEPKRKRRGRAKKVQSDS